MASRGGSLRHSARPSCFFVGLLEMFRARCVVVLDGKSRAAAHSASSPFNMLKQEPISGVASVGHLPGYQACSAGDSGLLSPAASMTVPKNYLSDDRGLLGGTAFSTPGPVGVHHPQMTRVGNLRVNYANRGSTIRSYHCRLCRKVSTIEDFASTTTVEL